jgi:hypothetical protein
MDNNHGPYQRVLFRQKIKLNWLEPLRQKPAERFAQIGKRRAQ